MKIHLIAIGGSAMHNLAIVLRKAGHEVSGSDDEIFEPSRSRLKSYDLLPEKEGWDEARITTDLDAVILGMHARRDNPELKCAQSLGLPILSYPEYIYEQSKDKQRVVIAGSHGKTTITAMVMHVLKYHQQSFDYLVGAQLDGFDTMAGITTDAPHIILEGDEYLSSPIDSTPKFHHYQPHIALITGISYDHVNVYPTFDEYLKQFEIFIKEKIEAGGTLIYNEEDPVLVHLVREHAAGLDLVPYKQHPSKIMNHQAFLVRVGKAAVPVAVFGHHNMQNINGALQVCRALQVSDDDFYKAIAHFKGASRRLEKIAEKDGSTVYYDFAHSPSKLKATIDAVKEQYPNKKLIAVFELHTFSSQNEVFLAEYEGTVQEADEAVVYFDPKAIKAKGLPMLEKSKVQEAFGRSTHVYNDISQLKNDLLRRNYENTNILFMTSGHFSGMDINEFVKKIK